MSLPEGVRVLDVDPALASAFVGYAGRFGAAHDPTHVGPDALASFDPHAEPAVIALDAAGAPAGAASAMPVGAADDEARLRIVHAADARVYAGLLAAVTARLPGRVRCVSLFVPEHAGDLEDVLADAGFHVTHRAYVLRHPDPVHVSAPQLPSESHVEPATPAVAHDWASIVSSAFRGHPGHHDLTTDEAAAILAGPDVVPGATLLAFRRGVPSAAVLTTLDARDPGVAEIRTLAVYPAEQGNGLGRALLLMATSAAGRHGCITVRLAVATYSRRAVALYLDHGFRAEDVRVCWQARTP